MSEIDGCKNLRFAKSKKLVGVDPKLCRMRLFDDQKISQILDKPFYAF